MIPVPEDHLDRAADRGPDLIARTGLGRRAIDVFERRVLERMPGFAMLRSIVRRVSGSSEDSQFEPVLVEIEEALTPAFIVADTGNARYPCRRALAVARAGSRRAFRATA